QLDRIRQARPSVIRGYASSLYLLAKTAHDHNVDDIRPRATISMGSVLFGHYRQLIETQFDCPVYDVYGGEGMIIAGQFECGSFHIHAEGVIVEILKPDGTAAGPGELGSVILTNLSNDAMPFIRYQIGDLATLSDVACACGRGLPVADSIQGRESDIVVTPNGSYLSIHFFLPAFRSSNVDQFQVIQHKLDYLEVMIVKSSKYRDSDIEHIVDTIRAAGGDHLKVDLQFVEQIPPTRSGKRRFVISDVGHEHFRRDAG
ncbi:phenylacetate--CoA ligase family protein, partial [Chloroflexota bacterium]